MTIFSKYGPKPPKKNLKPTTWSNRGFLLPIFLLFLFIFPPFSPVVSQGHPPPPKSGENYEYVGRRISREVLSSHLFRNMPGLQSGPPATGLRKPESPKGAGESAGKSARKKRIAGSSAGRATFFGKRERHFSQQFRQLSPFSGRHPPPPQGPSTPPRHFWGIRAFLVL